MLEHLNEIRQCLPLGEGHSLIYFRLVHILLLEKVTLRIADLFRAIRFALRRILDETAQYGISNGEQIIWNEEIGDASLDRICDSGSVGVANGL